MRAVSFWPTKRSQRLGEDMAEDPRRLTSTDAWDAERIAMALVPRRDRLVDQLPRELAAARGLSRDQRELVVDEAIDYMVTEYAKPITDRDVLERAFWATASFRVKRVHEGRGATVRAGWHRVDVDDVEIAAENGDPAAHVVRAVEHGTLLEFAATLTEDERLVLACKYADGAKEQGRLVVARHLGMPVPRVRRLERAIARKLERFVAIVAAGSLCSHREPAIAALADGQASEEQARAARVHIEHCSVCKVAYVAHLRALRSGELPRRIAQTLPVPVGAEGARHRGSPWDAFVDWLSRPFTSEAANTGAQLAAGARGVGAVAATKLATICIGGAAVVGGATFCATSLLGPEPPPKVGPRIEAPPPTRTAPDRGDDRLPSAGPTLTAVREAADRAEARRRKQKRRERRRRDAQRTAFASGNPETRHERETPISPPVEVAGAPVQEFGPGPTGATTVAPAAAPSTGAPEFP